MKEISISVPSNIFDSLMIIAEDKNLKIQDVVRVLIYEALENHDSLSESAISELCAKKYQRDINRVKYNAIKNKRKYFLPQLCRKFALRLKQNNKNLSEGDMRLLLGSYLEEAALYGNEKEVQSVIDEECNCIKIMRGGYDD